MIYVCVPVHNEARTAGLVLWKVRQVFDGLQREYHLLVCDDASTDGSAAVLAAYARVLPMTVLSHATRRGYARTLEELLRAALQRTDRPKRDCVVTLHADFVHSPASITDMVKRLESGADLVVGELQHATGRVPAALRWVRRFVPRLLPVTGVRDSVSGFAALRLATLRQALRDRPEEPLLTTDGWCANAELLARVVPHARRLERVPVTARYDLRQRAARNGTWKRLVEAWHARGAIRAAARGHAAAAALLALLAAPPSVTGQAPASSSCLLNPLAACAAPVPFPIGERMTFLANYGVFRVGEATMEVAGVDTLHGTESVRLRFHIRGKALWYSLDQEMESWVGRHDFFSRRFVQDTEERGRQRYRRYDIFPDSGFFVEEGRDTTFATVPAPLDDAAFLFWIRTVPLEVGQRYEYHRYFRPDRNPVIVEVLKKERVRLPAGRFHAIVIHPIIPHGRGIFAEASGARIWISDDDRRLILALQSDFSFGTVTLRLKEYAVPEHP